MQGFHLENRQICCLDSTHGNTGTKRVGTESQGSAFGYWQPSGVGRRPLTADSEDGYFGNGCAAERRLAAVDVYVEGSKK